MSTALAPVASASTTEISAGLDARYTPDRLQRDDLRLQGLFANVRRVWNDPLGDRWIGVAQADLEDNAEHLRPYQIYLQYKGPLGQWNIRGGHYLLPFGLLATHDTERLLLTGLEDVSLGIRTDTGLELLGFIEDWDYALSISGGQGDRRFPGSRAGPVVTARLAHVTPDFQLAAFGLLGRVRPGSDHKPARFDDTARLRRLGIDVTAALGPLSLRAEALGGTDDGHAVAGGNALVDYSLNADLELNLRYGTWRSGSTTQFLGLGITYRLWPDFYLRVADEVQLGREDRTVFTVQLYYEIRKAF